MKNNHQKGSAIIWILIIIVVIGGIFLWKGKKVTPTTGEQSTSGQTNVDPTVACTITPKKEIDIYMRPTKDSQKFGTATPQDKLLVAGKTSNGWYGFDPASAQAPNVGPFRLRYIAPDADVTVAGFCENVPSVVSLPANTCFEMAQTDISIYKTADKKSKVIAMMHAGDYIPAVGKSAAGDTYFLKLDAASGSTLAPNTIGWITSADVNYNGPSCDTLPIVK